ncbi:hypothetical protein CkaCkLH20_09297 [Colletotrichum karsti]|uniref:Cytochrome b5 heme-binding domain-containing protein n=1 Tax=Colletotrichum karsti TaxID=1095194 RepID=A0A9P6LEG3_9PEZI|nr:uncharacterized protein CkaCkLH20_09297 [Colletotrichum karsti]KAF9873134.1 hypothetical protein CkaCkLH20_09297 [Colletotrichum karsti]
MEMPSDVARESAIPGKPIPILHSPMWRCQILPRDDAEVPNSTMTSSMMKVFTQAELSKHYEVHDLWVSIRGKVYDVSSYVDDHPGGVEVLKDVAGSDGTESFEYVGHSEDAQKTLAKYQIGVLEGELDENRVEGSAQAWDAYREQVKNKLPKPQQARWHVAVTLILTAGMVGRRALKKQDTSAENGFILVSPTPPWHVLSSFWAGAIVAMMMSMGGYLYLYTKFTKTLEYYGEVWEYPSYFSCKANRADI